MNRLVALDLTGGPRFLELVKRAWDAGDAVLPLDQRLPYPAKTALLNALHPSVIVGEDGAEQSLTHGVDILSGDAVVLATSGTTGTPKGVILSHYALQASAYASAKRLRVDPQTDRWFGCLPVAHIGGFSVITKALLTGTPLTLAPSFRVEEVNDIAQTHSLVSLVVTAFSRVDTDRWRVILLGGSSMPEELAPNVVRTYGMTETGSGLVYDGIALSDAEIRVVEGEIHVRGPMLSRGYRSVNPDGVDARVDGWFATGDAGSIDATGRLTVVGRIVDVIVTGGEKVWPDAVERALRGTHGVAECAVSSRPDPDWGHRVVVWVVPSDPANLPTLDNLRTQVKITLPAYAAPKEIVFVSNLPTTALGKVQRNRLL